MVFRSRAALAFPVCAALLLSAPSPYGAGAQLGPRAADAPPDAGQVLPTSFLPDSAPYQLWNGLVVVVATTPDGLPQRAVVSTALPVCVLSPYAATRMGTKSTGARDVLVLDRAVRMPTAPPMALRVGRMAVEGVHAGIADLYSQFAGAAPPDAPALWLGTSFLAAACFTIDPAKKQITFRRPTDPLPSRATVIPFELKGGRIWIEVKANGKRPFRALLDTSSIGTLIPAKVAQELQLAPAATVAATLPNGKEGKVAVADLSELALGDAKATDVQALYVVDSAADAIDPDFAVIGSDVLLRYRITVNYRDQKVAFEKLPKPKPPPPPKGGAPGGPALGAPVPGSPGTGPAPRPAAG